MTNQRLTCFSTIEDLSKLAVNRQADKASSKPSGRGPARAQIVITASLPRFECGNVGIGSTHAHIGSKRGLHER